MNALKTTDPFALNFLMTDDLYSIKSDTFQDVPVTKEEPQAVLQTNDPPATAAPVPMITEIPNETVAQNASVSNKSEPPAFYEYLGENNKYILILFNDPAQKTIDPKELETLANILKGKKQEIKDVALVNLYNYPTATFSSLKSFFACNSVLLFGTNPAQLGIDGIQSNQITSIQGIKILATFSIAEMLTNVDKKRAFWDEMKKL
jgi:hypothetical protein